jgi:lysine-specific permease
MTTLSQRLKPRHVNMIALGGSIGTGIFLASGYSISIAGPGGALLAYSLMALIVYFLMTSLAEMSSYRPSSGTFCDYSSIYVGKSFGFAMGYNYWLNWAITIAAEISAAALIMNYWFPGVNSLIFSGLFFTTILLFNIFSVNVYGEIEYWLSFMKVAVIVVFIILGTLAISHQPQFGAHNWHIGDAPFHHGYLGFIAVFLFAGFSFQGTELVGVASGETKNAHIAIPNSIKLVFWRLTLFYVISIAVISLLIAYTDPRLASQDNVSMSPYTLVFSQYVSHYAADVVNLVILIALLSAANASMYSSTRILWYLGEKGDAPKVFSRITKHGVPIAALIATAFIGAQVFLASFVGNGTLFAYLVQISSLSGFIAWFGIAYSHYKFRNNYLPAHEGVGSLIYKAKFFPYAQMISMLVIGAVIAAQFFPIIDGKQHSVMEFVIIYSSVILFALIYLAHKVCGWVKSKKLNGSGSAVGLF